MSSKQKRKNGELNKLFFISFCLSAIFLFTGCLQTESGTATNSSTSPNTPSNPGSGTTTVDLGFAGVSTVENIDGSTIKVSWSAATSPSTVAYRVYEVAANGDLTALIQVPSNFLTYYHTGLIEGTYHSYVVRAVNASSQTDGNLVMKFGYTYSGVAGVSITGNTTATIAFNPTGPGTLGAKIYGIARGQTFLLGSTNNTTSSFNATGLKSGVTYQFKVAALTTAGIEDTNTTLITDQTTPLNSTNYKGPLLVQAYGLAANAPSGPTARQVSLTWVGFTGNTTSTTYKVVRVTKGGTVDVTTTTDCTSTTTASCNVVCAAGSTSLTGDGARTCIDTNVDAPPAAYDYVVTLNIGGWPEESLASQDVGRRISVQIPPSNMILVHRDSANYEQCALMSRIPDPLNHQRCAYTGLGAVPYSTGSSLNNSPLNLSNSFYDFGYNLFVDRWEAACNWSRSAATQIGSNPPVYGTGKCGASAANGDCFGSGTPAGTIGDINNVYYDTTNGNCFVKTAAATWTDVNSTGLTTAQRVLAYTNNPGTQNGQRPPMVRISQPRAQDTCAATVSTNYGAKRLLRQREFRAVAAWSNLTGEPGAVSDTTIAAIESTTGAATHTTLNYCNSNTHSNITATDNFGNAGYELTRQSTAGPESFVIGSSGTKACVSRFGAQDTIGNVWEWVSDQITCVAGTKICTGVQSPIETGNGFSAGFDMNGFLFDGSTNGPGGASFATDDWDFNAGSNSSTYFNTTLGLPLVNSNGGNAILTTTFQSSNKFHGDHFWLSPANGNTSRGLFVGGSWNLGVDIGRWASYWSGPPSISSSLYFGFRCSLPAE